MELEKELRTFKRELPNLLAEERKFVVISDDQVAGIRNSHEDGLTIGYERCGLKPFMVKKIQVIEQFQVCSRDLTFTRPV